MSINNELPDRALRELQETGFSDADDPKDKTDSKASHMGVCRMPGEGNKEDVNVLYDSYVKGYD
jgi:hypothetical protein